MKERIPYLDTIRFAAMFMVVICHACDPFNAGATYGAGEVNQEMFFWGSVWGSCVRACVPLFVMLTGALCLTTELPMQTFWKKKISRVLWPFLIWSVLYNMFPWFVKILGQPESLVHYFFVWAPETSGDLAVCLKRVAQIPLTFDLLACPLWYVYMLIGLYLYIPIFASWVRGATRKQIELVLLIWLASTCLPFLNEFVGGYFLGECEWNSFGMLYYFAGFSGYMLLGHYLVKYVPVKVKASWAFAIPAFAIGAYVSYRGFRYMTALPDATPEQMELFWYYCSPQVILATLAIFLALRTIPVKGKVADLLCNFTKCGFGIYLIHYFFIGPTYGLVEGMHLPVALRVPVAAAFVLAIAWAIVAAIKHFFPRTKWLLG